MGEATRLMTGNSLPPYSPLTELDRGFIKNNETVDSDLKTKDRTSNLCQSWKVCGPTFVIIALVLVVFIIMICYVNQLTVKVTPPILGNRGDTIFMSDLPRLWFSEVCVFQCDEYGDSSHADVLYLTKKQDIIVQERNITLQSGNINQKYSSPKTGSVSFMYLLADSVIEYTLCVGSHENFEQKGTLFMFDDSDNYWHYQDSPEQGEQLSIFSETFSIGKNDQARCITVHYRTLKASYYFIASRTPPQIFYSSNYTNVVRYYNTSSYTAGCTINLTPCTLSIPGHVFSNEEYVLLAYIVPNEDVTSTQTHLCLTTKQSGTITFIEALCGSVAGILALSVALLIFVVCVMSWRNRNRKGYQTIDRVPHYQYY